MPKLIYQPITRASALEPGEVVLKMLQKKLPRVEPEALSRLVYSFLDPNIVSFSDFSECPLCINSVYGLFRRKISKCDYVEPLQVTGNGVVVAAIKPINVNTDGAVFTELLMSGTLRNGDRANATFNMIVRTGEVCMRLSIYDLFIGETVYDSVRCIPFRYGWLGIVNSYDFDYDPVRQQLVYADRSPFLFVNGEMVDFNDVIRNMFLTISAGTAGITLWLPLFRGECDVEISPGVFYKGSLDYVIDYYIIGTPSGPIS